MRETRRPRGLTDGAAAVSAAPAAGRIRGDFDTFRTTRLFSGLDALRAISVIGVIWQHTSGTPGPAFSRQGALGVQLFFAISGFLITTLLLRERERRGAISLRAFYARRALRIFPLYYVTLVAYTVLVVATRLDTSTGQAFIRNLPAFATYTSNWFVDLDSGPSVIFYFAWSLATEEQFYLFWPTLLVLLLIRGSGRAAPPLAALAALIVVSQCFVIAGNGDVLWQRMIASLSLPILLGAALAVLLHHRRTYDALATALGRRWSPLVAVVLLAVAIVAFAPRQVIEVLMVILVATVVLREDTLLHPILRWRPLARIGVISYGIYLLHMLAANVVRMVVHQQSTPLVFALTVVLVIVIASISFRFFETPILRLKRRFEMRDQTRGDELRRAGTA